MPSIYLNDDLEPIRAQVRSYVSQEIVGRVEDWDRERAVPRPVLDEMGKLGFFGLRIPEEYGGLGLGT